VEGGSRGREGVAGDGRGREGVAGDGRGSIGRRSDRVATGRWNDDAVGSTENLADVDVVAARMDLRVVLVKEGGVCTMHGGDSIAGITRNNDYGRSERVNR
jgi:hypothetical protein